MAAQAQQSLTRAGITDYMHALLLSGAPEAAAVRAVLAPGAAATTHGHGHSHGHNETGSGSSSGDGVDAPRLDIVVKEDLLHSSPTASVFTVANQAGLGGSVLVKQSAQGLKHALTIEALTLTAFESACAGCAATVLYHDEAAGLVIYNRLTPHVVLRAELVTGEFAAGCVLHVCTVRSTCSRLYSRQHHNMTTSYCIVVAVAGNAYEWLPLVAGRTLAMALFAGSIYSSAKPAAMGKALAAVRAADNNAVMRARLEHALLIVPYLSSAPASAGAAGTTALVGSWAAALASDAELCVLIAQLREKLNTHMQALLHGNLHTGALLAASLQEHTPALRPFHYDEDEQRALLAGGADGHPRTHGDLRIVDAGHAFVGPIGLDVGTLISNLLTAYIGTRAKARSAEAAAAKGGYARFTNQKVHDRWAKHADWLLTAVRGVWSTFVVHFLRKWDEDRASAAGGDASVSAASPNWRYQVGVLANVLEDAISFAGADIIRRVLAAENNAELEKLDQAARPPAEARALALGNYLVKHAATLAAAAHSAHAALPTTVERGVAVATLQRGVDGVAAAAAVIDREAGWQVGTPAAPPLGRAFTSTIVVVADGQGLTGNSAVAAAVVAQLQALTPSKRPAAAGADDVSVVEHGHPHSVRRLHARRLLWPVGVSQATAAAIVAALTAAGAAPELLGEWSVHPSAAADGAASVDAALLAALAESGTWGPAVFVRVSSSAVSASAGTSAAVTWARVVSALHHAAVGHAHVESRLPDGRFAVVGLPAHLAAERALMMLSPSAGGALGTAPSQDGGPAIGNSAPAAGASGGAASGSSGITASTASAASLAADLCIGLDADALKLASRLQTAHAGLHVVLSE